MKRFQSVLLFALMLIFFGSCGGGGGGSTTSSNPPIDNNTSANSDDNQSSETTNSTTVQTLRFNVINDTQWDESAVKRVLDAFAYGGHATDAQIQKWANMSPQVAIVEMLNGDATNALLSPSNSTLPDTVSLELLANFWSGNDGQNFLDQEKRPNYELTSWNIHSNSWMLSVMSRGLNPFLHRLGLWETNYHMSVNADAGVYPLPMLHHYDNILTKIAYDAPYEEVIAQGAKNAAVAYQYGHNKNLFKDGQFKGNEDFAREYHQLFLGILGDYDHLYHEETTIPYTARALTDMQANWHSTQEGGPDSEITFGSENHYTGDLKILNSTIAAASTADTQLDAIAALGIMHQESLKNLPLMIVRHFGDDNLSDATVANIQASWEAMNPKSLIGFLQAYAISTDFHSASRFKYSTSIDRVMRIANLMVIDNSDNAYEQYNPNWYLGHESISIFRPIHDVFGHQTSLEASGNANLFQVNYNRSVEKTHYYTNSYYAIKDANGEYAKDSEGNRVAVWEKDWSKIIPANSNGDYLVQDTALWLWKRFIGDGGKHYGVLEKAHLVALLNGKDLALFIDESKPLEVYTPDRLATSSIAIKIDDGGIAKMNLNSDTVSKRREANERVGLAIAFIVATPYIYAQEGK